MANFMSFSEFEIHFKDAIKSIVLKRVPDGAMITDGFTTQMEYGMACDYFRTQDRATVADYLRSRTDWTLPECVEAR